MGHKVYFIIIYYSVGGENAVPYLRASPSPVGNEGKEV